MSATRWYKKISGKMTHADIEAIVDYYDTWKGQDTVNLKFRFIKIVGRTKDDHNLKWYHLHQLVNKRRINNNHLPNYINQIITDGIIPLRIFHSCVEWLAPNEVYNGRNTRIIKSGIIAYENDTDLNESIETAKEVIQFIDEPIIVYSGNKSIHVWERFDAELRNNKELAYADLREKRERKTRMKRFREIQEKISHPLDQRVSTDSRRIIPMIDSLNALTGRRVMKLTYKLLTNPDEIMELASIN